MYRDNDVVLGGLSMRLFSVFCARDTFVLESQLGVILRSCICNVVIAMPYKVLVSRGHGQIIMIVVIYQEHKI